MKTQKRSMFAGLVILLIVIGGAIWLINRDSPTNFEKIEEDNLSGCQRAAPGYVGLPEAEAITKAESHATAEANQENHSHRVISRDGVGQTLSADLVPSRLNFEVNKGVVEKVTCG